MVLSKIALALLPSLLASAANVVDLGYASYAGNLSFPNTVAYLGLPYAEPPLGNLRFRAPVVLNTARVAKETGGKVVDASQYPNFCIQGSTGAGDAGGAGSEDCLKVNVYAPAGAKRGDDLPVLVYIHGGGYFYGNPANWPFDGWVHQSPNVVIVSVYYRLDAFGFLSHPDFTDPKIGDFNAGFLDQTMALEWIQAHIHAFGGDPTKVTINGESAGGSSVELHLVADSDKGKNLFRGVIAQSVYRTPLAKPEQRVQQFDVFAQEAGCGTGAVAAQMACLRNASVSALARAQDATSGSTAISPVTGYKLFQPVLDGTVFKDFPTHEFTTSGAFADVPVIVGSTTNETLSGGTSIAAALEAYFPSMTNSSADALVAQYPVADFSNSTALQFQAATGESELLCARHVIASAVSERTNAWTYRYNQPNPTGGSAAVGHAAENWMMFNGINTGFNGTGAFSPMTPTEDAFAAELIAYWLSFVRAQNPNTYKLSRSPEWKQFSRTSKERMVLQQGPGTSTDVSGSFLEVQSAGETQRCEFVASQVGVQQN